MATLQIRPAGSCRWDELSLGEVMIRLDPGEGRIRTARSFKVWEGGGEYNVARGLARCFGMRTAIATALVDNDIGLLLQDLLYQGGVDQSLVVWMPFDGVGRDARIGLNFTERGFGVRGAVGISDRANSAASKLKKGDFDWKRIFSADGARWLHCGGIFAALSTTTPEVVLEAMAAARAAGTVISYDLNFRPSLWKASGGKQRAIEVNREIAKSVDVMIGNEEDFTAALGFEVEGVGGDVRGLAVDSFKRMIAQVTREFPNLKAVATTLREVHSATINDWGAVLWYDGEFSTAAQRNSLEIMDRVGGGDSFASGLIYGLLSGKNPQECVELGAAHGALAMTTPGDTSMASWKEVEKLAAGGGARVQR